MNFTPDFHESGVCLTKYILIKGSGGEARRPF